MASVTPISPTSRAPAMRRPGWTTFAAVITFVVAGIHALISLTEFANSTWFFHTPYQTYNLWNSHMFWWGVFDVAIAVIALVAGLSLLGGGVFGLVTGLCGAAFGALRWLYYIPASPVLAVVIIAIDIMVIYALCRSVDFLTQAESGA